MDLARLAWAHAERLSGAIGPRPLGSPGYRAAADYIEGVLQRAGLRVRRQPFPCPEWSCQETHLACGAKALPAAANWFSPPCDLSAPIVAAETLEQLEAVEAAGRILLLHGTLTQEDVMPRRSIIYYPDPHRRLNELVDAKQPAALIAVRMRPGSLRRVFADPDLAIPSVTVPPEAGAALLRSAGEAVRLRIVSSSAAGQGWNIIGEREGRRQERLVISAHYDTVLDTPGAIDNASGVSVMLALAERLAAQDLDTGLEFVAFGSEDCAWFGTDAYLSPYGLTGLPARMDRFVIEMSPVWLPILANINIDGVGELLGPTNVATIACSQGLAALVDEIRSARHTRVIPSGPWPASDHYSFYSHGVPAIALNCAGVSGSLNHEPTDTLDWVSAERLGEAVAFVADIVAALQSRPAAWCRD